MECFQLIEIHERNEATPPLIPLGQPAWKRPKSDCFDAIQQRESHSHRDVVANAYRPTSHSQPRNIPPRRYPPNRQLQIAVHPATSAHKSQPVEVLAAQAMASTLSVFPVGSKHSRSDPQTLSTNGRLAHCCANPWR